MAVIGEGARAVRVERRKTTRGLIDPNPGVKRIIGPSAVWSPEIVAGDLIASSNPAHPNASTANSSIPNSVFIPAYDPTDGTQTAENPKGIFRYLGAQVTRSAAYPYWRTNTGPHVMGFAVEFHHYGRYLEWATLGRGSDYWITVDGKYATAAPVSGMPSDGAGYLVPWDFGSVAWRTIKLWITTNGQFAGVRIGPNDTVCKPFTPKGDRVLFLGDSFTEGTGAASTLMGYPYRLADLMGWHDVFVSGLGGTGYLAPGPSPRVKFRDRTQADVIDADPDIVIIAGGINDTSKVPFSAQDIEDEAVLLYEMIRTGCPQATLIVIGPWWKNGTPSAPVMQTRDAIYNASIGRAHLFIDTLGEPIPYSGSTGDYTGAGFMTGYGYVGGEAGTGNSDIFTGADNTHPTTAGHLHLACQLAGAIAAGMPL